MKKHKGSQLASIMSLNELLNNSFSSDVEENSSMRRKRKWKELRLLYNILTQKDYSHGSIENALWFYSPNVVTLDIFIAAMMAEFQFDRALCIDNNLRWLYWSFEGGTKNSVDWRDIVVAYKIIVFFRLVRNRTIDLLVILFDVFASNKEDPVKGLRGDPDDSWYIPNANVYLKKIFTCVCQSDFEAKGMEDLLIQCVDSFYQSALFDRTKTLSRTKMSSQMLASKEPKALPHKIMRKEFKKILEASHTLVTKWQHLAWARLPTDLRLLAYDEAQVRAVENIDKITLRFKLEQALRIYHKLVYKKMFKEWKIVIQKEAKLNKYIIKKVYRKFKVSFKFWRFVSSHKHLRRQRRLLAEVMSCYSIKARCFARIKLFIYQNKKVMATVGPFNPNIKRFREGVSHIRTFRKLATLREFYHIWWGVTVELINWDLATDSDNNRRLTPIFKAWAKWANFEVMTKRMELMVLENKASFDKRMEETEILAKEMIVIEMRKKKEREEVEVKQKEEEKKERLEAARRRAQATKVAEQNLLKDVQRDARRRRVAKEMKKLKKKFNKKWTHRRLKMLEDSRLRVEKYIDNIENTIAIIMKFEKLKKEFFAPPSVENRERELILTNPKNIVFLFLEAKLEEQNIKLKDIIRHFDTESRGYLTHEEFIKMIKSLGVKLNPVQINDVIKGVDKDGDGYVDIDELRESMKDTLKMGVPGCEWKMYVDPAQDVICYHNMKTDQKIFEYQMKDENLMEIARANLFGEAWSDANSLAMSKKEEDWNTTLCNHMIRKMQYMFRFWKARRKRRQKIYKIQNKEANIRRVYHQKIVSFVERLHMGCVARAEFAKQLHFTYEKVWDTEIKRLFWYNHKTKISSWERPKLLWRYGDCSKPSSWVVHKAHKPATVDGFVHYWHVPSSKELPRKPDGLPACSTCNTNLAIHYCIECGLNYCSGCHRDSHSNPMGFAQNRKVRKKESIDHSFMQRLNFFKTHTWRPIRPIRCSYCKSDKIFAGIHCEGCNNDMCRPCSRRIHAHGNGLEDHVLFFV